MILVDSSVWIAHLRNQGTAAVGKFRSIRDPNEILVGDLIIVEVLQGARDEAHAARLEAILRRYVFESMLGSDLAVTAARNYRALRGKGITVRTTVDLIIATFCVERGHALLHDDRDFDPLAAYLGLTVM
jgi:predicted nucleic acid-binding protein